MNRQSNSIILIEFARQILKHFFRNLIFENPLSIKRKKLPKGPLTTQYIGGIVADQLSKMAATIIGSSLSLANSHVTLIQGQQLFYYNDPT